MAFQGGHGVVLKITSGSLIVVTNLMDVSFPEQAKFLAEATFHDSASAYLEYIDTGLRELTEMEATVAWDSAATSHAAILTSFAATTAVGMSIEDPNGDEVIAFNAHIKKVGRVAKSRELYSCVITIQPTGGPTIT